MPQPTSRYTIFVLLRALPSWLALAREQRNDIGEKAISHALKGLLVKLRHYDSEAFSGFCSDLSVFETDDLMDFYFVMERLRDSALFTKPYFEIVQIIPTIEDGFRQFEQAEI